MAILLATMTGIEEIWDTVLDHKGRLEKSGELEEKRKKQALNWMWSLVDEGLKERFYESSSIKKLLNKITREVETGVTASTDAAFALLSLFDDRT